MDARVITEDMIFFIVKILIEDPEVVINRERLSLALGLTLGTIVDIGRIPMNANDTQLFLTSALAKWVSKFNATSRTIATLASILRSEGFIATSDKIIQFGEHVEQNEATQHLVEVKTGTVDENYVDFPLCLNVPENSSILVGRDEDIERLHESITQQNFQTTNEKSCKDMTVLTTMSANTGMGKSVMARHYALKYFKSEFYFNVIWINSESPHSISCSLRELAEKVGISVHLQEAQIAQKIYKYCQNSMTLIVFHNVKSLKSIASFLPTISSEEGLKPFVLCTSFYHDCIWDCRADIIYLNAFNVNDSSDFLASILNTEFKTEEEKNLGELICSKLGNLPVALKLAGVFIRNGLEDEIETPTVVRLKNYLQLLDQNTFQITINVSNIFETYAFTAWKITIQNLNVQNPMVERIMQIIAYMSPNNIPISLLHQIKLESHVNVNYFNKVQATVKGFLPDNGTSTSTQAQGAVQLLLSYAIITKETETTVRIHPLLQNVVRAEVEEQSQFSTLKDVISFLRLPLKNTNYTDYEKTCLMQSAFVANYMFSNDIKIGGYPSKLYAAIMTKQGSSIPQFIDRLEELIADGKEKNAFELYCNCKEMFDVQLKGVSPKSYTEIFAIKTVIMFCRYIQVLFKNGSSLRHKLLMICKMCVAVLTEVKMLKVRWQIGMNEFSDTADALICSVNFPEDRLVEQHFLKIQLLMYNILFVHSKTYGVDSNTQRYWKCVLACQHKIELIERNY